MRVLVLGWDLRLTSSSPRKRKRLFLPECESQSSSKRRSRFRIHLRQRSWATWERGKPKRKMQSPRTSCYPILDTRRLSGYIPTMKIRAPRSYPVLNLRLHRRPKSPRS
ncbi:hypothetical protein RSOL_411280 [Rhizoctonia solani AG-3 Rhs1AP]|uniref:Uncharacterized protein n=1 Tax=Rhizoctonia solani AG-3 Rhs1AP TaxID=1086054 RepID=X8JE07_9AGAM|nr:hypothetical protein RSOL_411280 [Rhizoctonia solani AG-3 Rhs1AP]